MLLILENIQVLEFEFILIPFNTVQNSHNNTLIYVF
jgi:hypothetical protein